MIDGLTFANEIGHAKFGVLHPDNDVNIWDKQNFMYSKPNNRINRIRFYQWKEI